MRERIGFAGAAGIAIEPVQAEGGVAVVAERGSFDLFIGLQTAFHGLQKGGLGIGGSAEARAQLAAHDFEFEARGGDCFRQREALVDKVQGGWGVACLKKDVGLGQYGVVFLIGVVGEPFRGCEGLFRLLEVRGHGLGVKDSEGGVEPGRAIGGFRFAQSGKEQIDAVFRGQCVEGIVDGLGGERVGAVLVIEHAFRWIDVTLAFVWGVFLGFGRGGLAFAPKYAGFFARRAAPGAEPFVGGWNGQSSLGAAGHQGDPEKDEDADGQDEDDIQTVHACDDKRAEG